VLEVPGRHHAIAPVIPPAAQDKHIFWGERQHGLRKGLSRALHQLETGDTERLRITVNGLHPLVHDNANLGKLFRAHIQVGLHMLHFIN
jgi:hypothetical protein